MKRFREYLKWGAILTACLLAGLMLCIMAVREPEFSLASSIFAFVCGLIFLALPALFAVQFIRAKVGRRKNKDGAEEGKRLSRRERRRRSLLPWYDTIEQDDDRVGSMIRDFRGEYGTFFDTPGIPENSPVQNNATQLFRSILAFRKKRLDRKGITLRFQSERKKYGSGEAVSSATVFDGKYEVTQVTETIAARSTFLRRDGETICTRLDTQAAHYTMINAKKVGKSGVICPNCGAKTTREQLLDGCDYCGSAVTVEDLGTKVAGFALRDNYEIQYAKFKTQREHFGLYVFLAVAVPIFLIGVIMMLSMGKEELLELGDGSMAIALLATLMGSALAGAMIGLLGMYAFWFFIFPFVQIGASAGYYTKKSLDRLKSATHKDEEQEASVRRFDPLFSLTGFYSNVQNKLASIHYADTEEGINAFSDVDLKKYLHRYADVIDVDFREMALEAYAVDHDLQRATVTAGLTLTIVSGDGRRAETRTEKLRLRLAKSASCKTQAVSGPRVLTCGGCGISLSLTEGKTCPQCGRVFDFKQHDWMITDYEIMSV